MNEQLSGRMDRHPGKFGSDLASRARMRVARAAVLFEEGLALSHITAGKHHREDLVDHFLAIGVRQAIARGDQFFGPLAELLVGEFGEPVSIHEGQVGEPDCARLESLDQHRRPGLVVHRSSEGSLAEGRWQRASRVKDRLGGAWGV